MKIRAFRKKEDGAVAVLVALSMTVLFGFAALAVDFGMMASCRASLQNTADAASLAGAADLGAKKSALVDSTVYTYCELNGFDPDAGNSVLEISMTSNTVTVRLSRTLQMGFSAVLTGQRTRTVSVSATAQASSIFGNYPFAMFAGQRIEDDGSGIAFTGNNIQINGDIHSNADIIMRNAVLGENAAAYAVRNTIPATAGWNNKQTARDMPRFHSFESALDDMPEVVEFPGSIVKNSQTGFQDLIDEATSAYADKNGNNEDYYYDGLFIRIRGDLTFNGSNSTEYTAEFPIVLIVDGDIDLNGACLNSSYEYPIYVMSKGGDITVNGGGADFHGIIYAPQGNVTINGNGVEITGSIVAQNIRKSGGKTTISYEKDLDRFLPQSKVRLVA